MGIITKTSGWLLVLCLSVIIAVLWWAAAMDLWNSRIDLDTCVYIGSTLGAMWFWEVTLDALSGRTPKR